MNNILKKYINYKHIIITIVNIIHDDVIHYSKITKSSYKKWHYFYYYDTKIIKINVIKTENIKKLKYMLENIIWENITY